MEILQFVGLSPMEVIVAGTRNAARALGIDDWLGTLEPGMTADLIAIEGDPLACLTALGEVRLVIKDGKIIHRRDANP